MKTPFKLLDAFELKDHKHFFGRSEEIKREYRDALRTRLMMIYGLSGTGKTSLIKCGLAGKFDAGDWFPLYVRPGDNVNQSLKEAITQALNGENVSGDLLEDIKELTAVKLRPVYIIFDQFEEFFTLNGNTRAVQEKFMENLRAILDAKIRCRVILILREEYIAQLYPFESIVPELFNFRFRVERMNTEKVKEVIRSSFKEFNIHIEEPIEDNLDLMVHNISGGDGIIDLPYLQIYLDTLYQQDYRDTYGEEGTTEKLPRLDITRDEIQKLGEIEDVLSGFLDKKMRTYYRFLRKKYEGFPQKGIARVLDQMVTDEGTKKPIKYRIEEEILIPEFSNELISGIEKIALSELIYRLSDDRIIRINPDTIELAHDSLAAIIADRRTDKEKQLLFQFRRIQNAYDEYIATDKNIKQLLTKEQLFVITPFLKDLHLKEKYNEFVGMSQENVERERALVRARRQKEIDDRDAVIEAQKNAFVEKENAEEARNEALEQRKEAIQARNEADTARVRAEGAERKVRRMRMIVVGGLTLVFLVVAGRLWWGLDTLEEQNVTLVTAKDSLVTEKEMQRKDNEIVLADLKSHLRVTADSSTVAEVDSIKMEIAKNDDLSIKVVPNSFATYVGNVKIEGQREKKRIFNRGEAVYFFTRLVVQERKEVYVKYVPEGALPDEVKETVVNGMILPNPIGYRLNGGIGGLMPGKYHVIILTEAESGVTMAIDSVAFEVLQ
ncbi:MAG: hypothetical protein DRI69_03525 [Bacteroidetes bacterium]|nr:MAG: hypothetical protein DRI69_03525 [Bacteroidota bacterium]